MVFQSHLFQIQAWYNFLPDIDYATLSSEEVEHEFSKRSRALQDFNEKFNFGMGFDDGSGGGFGGYNNYNQNNYNKIKTEVSYQSILNCLSV